MRGTIKAPLQTGLGNESGWANNSMPHINLGYGGQQGLGQVAHHMNPNLTPEGNVNVQGLQNAREEQFKRTGNPLGTGWGGGPTGLENQNQSSNLPTSIPQSGTTFGVGNNQGLVANVEAGPVLPGQGRKVWPRDGSAPGRGGIADASSGLREQQALQAFIQNGGIGGVASGRQGGVWA